MNSEKEVSIVPGAIMANYTRCGVFHNTGNKMNVLRNKALSISALLHAVAFLLGSVLYQQAVAFGPGGVPDQKFQAGGIPNYKVINNNGSSISYEVKFFVMPHIASQGDLYLGGWYKNKDQGFGTYQPVKISSPQRPVTKGTHMVVLNHDDGSRQKTSDHVEFTLIQNGKNLVVKAFPFNIANYIQSPIKLPDSSTTPGPYRPMPRIPR